MKHRWMKHLHGLAKTSTLERSQAMPQETKRNKKHTVRGTHKKAHGEMKDVEGSYKSLSSLN